MNINSQNSSNGHAPRTAAHGDAEETLRLIASLPAPEGLEERVHRALSEARSLHPGPRKGQRLAWPVPLGMGGEWMRTAAAAAIALMIAGGGWGVYREVQPRQTVNGIRLVPHGANARGLEGASAMRTPQSLHGPIVSGPVVSGQAPAHPVEARPESAKNEKQNAGQGAPVQPAKGKNGTARARTGAKASAQAAQP
jgi:hypothetical protein